MKLPVYLDYMATTPVDPRVAKRMMNYLTIDGIFGNPASQTHPYGWAASEAVETARQQVADLLNADSPEIIWTSGATEANNLAIKGVAYFYRRQGNHIITSQTEHKTVLDTCGQLQREGFEITYLTPSPNGLIDLKQLAAAMRSDTLLVSIMHANNEIGVIQDIQAIGELTRLRGVLFHVDAAQSVGKIPIDVKALSVDLLSLSAHKIYGPKGIGALYVRHKPRLRLTPLFHGGGHEQGLRPGTLATHQIVGMGEALCIAKDEMAEEASQILALRQRLTNGLSKLQNVYFNGDLTQRLPGNLSVSFPGIDGIKLAESLKDLALSSTSACSSAALESSHVLRALGLSDAFARNTIRFSLGRFTSIAEVDFAIAKITEAVRNY